MAAAPSARVYRWLRGFLRLVASVFFRQIEVVGREHVPAPDEGPVIFAGNHPNSLIDPVLIVVSCGRVVQFAAKDVLFKSGLLRPFLRALGAVPVARRTDHADARQAAARNELAFDTLYDVLADGGAIGIFPEGLSHDAPQLARLKTGAARIALGVCARHPGLRVRVVPCGLTYMQRKRFRSRVLVQYGPPLEITAAPGAAGADGADPAAVARVTADLDSALRALTVNAADWDTLRVLDGIRRLYQPPRISIEARVELARRFNNEYPRVKDQPEVKALFARVAAYLDRLAAVGLGDRDLERVVPAGEALRRVARHLLLLLVWLPLALPGAVLHAPAGLLVRWTAPLITPRKDVIAATKLLAGMLVVTISYAAGIVWLGWRLGWLAALAALVALPLTGFATLRVMDRSASLQRGLRTLARLWSLREEREALRAERAALQDAVVRAVNRFRPEDMVLLFPREPTSGGAGAGAGAGAVASAGAADAAPGGAVAAGVAPASRDRKPASS
jgi:glycerol-3-phosphate O-acyltransferase/dihydroxyacetone phosphate acyltransferase